MADFRIRRALLSVTDKTGLVEFATFLAEGGVELVSTGGTAKMLSEAGLNVIGVDSVTGFPEMLGGRVKTLHPKIHGGILADRDLPEHMAVLDEHDIAPIDLVCVNLYNFSKAVAEGMGLKDAVELIDIGGPAMLRASAKNFHGVLVVPGTQFYKDIEADLTAHDFMPSLAMRRKTAAATFKAVSEYDSMIATYLAEQDL
jgi:phosphoribosylaminoimidazolecarboxamide formyltransferase/IMP cyclohydrolase